MTDKYEYQAEADSSWKVDDSYRNPSGSVSHTVPDDNPLLQQTARSSQYQKHEVSDPHDAFLPPPIQLVPEYQNITAHPVYPAGHPRIFYLLQNAFHCPLLQDLFSGPSQNQPVPVGRLFHICNAYIIGTGLQS